MGEIFIYGLYSNRNNLIRYIGKTISINNRLSSHINIALQNTIKKKTNVHKNNWIKREIKEGYEIKMSILEVCDKDTWVEREVFWIKQFKNLTNKSSGGEGYNRNYLPYAEAKIWVFRNLSHIKNLDGWRKNKINLPKNIPSRPDHVYENEGWVNWYEFLNKRKPEFLSYNNAKKYLLDLNIKTKDEYSKLAKNGAYYILPSTPYRYYKKEWIDWADFLNKKNKKFLNYGEFIIFIKNNPNLNTPYSYLKNYSFYENLPSRPNITYEKQCFTIFKKNKIFINYNEAKKLLFKLNIKTFSQYKKIYKLYNLPANPQEYYNKKGWVDHYDFFNKKRTTFVSYNEAKVITKNFKNITDYIKNYKLFEGLPSNPINTYKNNGWINWYDFLGKVKPIQINE